MKQRLLYTDPYTNWMRLLALTTRYVPREVRPEVEVARFSSGGVQDARRCGPLVALQRLTMALIRTV